MRKKSAWIIVIIVVIALVYGFWPKNAGRAPEPSSKVDATEIDWANKNKQQVVFTFDGGSGAQSAEAILATLKKYHVTGTFFVTGKFAEQNPELIKKIASAGHEVFNHTYNHPNLTSLSDAEIANELTRTEKIVSDLTGESTKPFYRPPNGDRDARVREAAAALGYRTVYWTVDALDWKESEGYTAEQTKARILDNLQPGTIYLMHIGDNITGQILDDIFAEIIAKGYSIVPLSEGIK